MSVTTFSSPALVQRQPNWIVRLFDYKPFLIVMCLAPAIGLPLPSTSWIVHCPRGARQSAVLEQYFSHE